MLVLLEIVSFAVDPGNNAPVMVLKEAMGARTFMVPVDSAQANAIAMKSLDVVPERPQAIDLVKILLDRFNAKLDRVVIHDFVDGGFQTRLHVVAVDTIHLIQCATSDGIALALRCNAPVFTTEAVFEKVRPADVPSDAQVLRNNIANLDTMEFGRHFPE